MRAKVCEGGVEGCQLVVSEPGNTSPPPPSPYYGTSRPVPPPKPTPLGSTGSGGGVVGTVRVGLCTAASPLDTHTAKDDGRVCM